MRHRYAEKKGIVYVKAKLALVDRIGIIWCDARGNKYAIDRTPWMNVHDKSHVAFFTSLVRVWFLPRSKGKRQVCLYDF